MVDIKGLDKEKVLKALCKRSKYLREEMMQMDLSGDKFDERGYDSAFGAGAAQRAVDSVRAEQEGGKDTAGNADGEKKEPSLEEQAEMTKEAIHKIMDILDELPPTCHIVASMMLKMALSGPVYAMTGMLMMGGPFSPSELFRPVEKPMGWPTGMGPLFEHDLFAHGRNG